MSTGFDIKEGWITPAEMTISPNCDERPNGIVIDLLVIHCISLPEGRYDNKNVASLFRNQLDTKMDSDFESLAGLTVSAHVLIDRLGGLTQFVSLDQRAWHAGNSCFGDRQRCNDFSIGIELLGCVNDRYESEQYVTLARLVARILIEYPSITRDNIVAHSDISPGRKFDPGPYFDWQRFFQTLDSAQKNESKTKRQ